MDIKEIMKMKSDIKLYDKGTSVMWTDEYISRQLLEVHIDPDNDLASRSSDKIDRLIQWIIDIFGRAEGNVLDIGCGPGLYTQRLAKKGYKVAGIDFSQNSIDYAVKSAEKEDLNIEYKCMNYLNLDYKEKADLIIMIYCDFCVLSEEEQGILLGNVYKALKPNGMFIFDVYNEESLNSRSFGNRWEFANDGFWRQEPYLNLSLTKHYEKHKAVLSQNIIYDEQKGFDVYRFWEHYFSEDDIYALFKRHRFSSVKGCGNILRSDTKTMEDGIAFYMATK